MEKKSTIYYLSAGIVIAIAIPVIFYVINFRNGVISNDSVHWGTFGDFFNGIATPIFAILNLIVLIQLTNAVSRVDNDRQIKELRIEAFNNLHSLLSKFGYYNRDLNEIKKIYSELEIYHEVNLYFLEGEALIMFKNINIDMITVSRSMMGFLQSLKPLKETNKLEDQEKIKKYSETVSELVRHYQTIKLNYILFLRDVIAKKNLERYKKEYLKPVTTSGFPVWVLDREK